MAHRGRTLVRSRADVVLVLAFLVVGLLGAALLPAGAQVSPGGGTSPPPTSPGAFPASQAPAPTSPPPTAPPPTAAPAPAPPPSQAPPPPPRPRQPRRADPPPSPWPPEPPPEETAPTPPPTEPEKPSPTTVPATPPTTVAAPAVSDTPQPAGAVESAPDPHVDHGHVPTPPTTVPSGGGGGQPADSGAVRRSIPADVQGILNSLVRSGANSTNALLDALKPLESLGFTEQEAALLGMGHFPVAGRAAFTDDWLMPRYTPSFHLHKGNDVFAAYGTPLRAPFDGTVRYSNEGAGGLAAYVTTADGTYYYMAHMSATATDLKSGDRVRQGQVVGFVGDSGNAVGGAPHLHLQIHPRGGEPINPKPILDAWLAEALAAARDLIASYGQSQPQVLASTGMIRRFDPDAGPFSGAADSVVDPLMMAASVGPFSSAIGLAEAQAEALAEGFDWEGRAASEQARLDEWRQANARALATLAPLSPPGMLRVMLVGAGEGGAAPG